MKKKLSGRKKKKRKKRGKKAEAKWKNQERA